MSSKKDAKTSSGELKYYSKESPIMACLQLPQIEFIKFLGHTIPPRRVRVPKKYRHKGDYHLMTASEMNKREKARLDKIENEKQGMNLVL